MADTIKIGNLDISSFKVGSDNCKIYLGDTLLYPQGETPYKRELSYLMKDSSHIGEVDLGLQITADFRVVMKIRYTNAGGSQFFGETDHSGGDADDFRFFCASNRVYFDYGSNRINGYTSTYLTTGSTDQEIELGNYYFKNITKNKQLTGSTQSARSDNFVAFRSAGSDYGRIYYIKIYSGNTLVGDFIPVIDNNDNYTFYNKITGTICAVTGTLTGGL